MGKKPPQGDEKRIFHDGNNLKTPVSNSAIVTSDYVDGNVKLTCFWNVFACFPQGCHAFTLAKTPVSLDGNLTETYEKVVGFRRKRSDENTAKRNASADGNMSLPSCFRNGFTCLR